MTSIAERMAAARAAAQQQVQAPVQQVQPSPVQSIPVQPSGVAGTGVAGGVAGTPAEAKAAEAKPKSAAEMLAAFKAAQAAKAPVAPAPAPAPAAKPREYPMPVGTPEVEQSHPDLCEATRKLAEELEQEQDGIRYWLDRVHEQLRQQPELVHMLTDDQASALYGAIIARSNIAIVPEKAKAASKAKGAPKVKLSDADM